MSFEVTGKLINIEKTQNISDSFKKRDFVIEVENSSNSSWVDFIKFQLTQTRCDLIDPFTLNDEIIVSFNLRGRKWEKDGKVSYFTNLEAWRIQKSQEQKTDTPTKTENSKIQIEDNNSIGFQDDSEVDDLPF